MEKTTLLVGVVAGIAMALLSVLGTGGGTASADGGPHIATGSDPTPDKCASCHRIHTGQNEYLLKAAGTVKDFCYSCHGNGGPGSDLAVSEGTFYGTPPLAGPPYGGATASTTVGLRAGGFEMARINTVDPTADTIGILGTAQAVTSWHTNDGTTAGTLWGNGALNSGAGPSYMLECTSCHDPHGNGQYRILRPIPAGSGAVAVNVTDEVAPKLYSTTNYFSAGPVSGIQMSSWCATCHTRYLAGSTANSGDAIFTYRHISNGTSSRACTTCHAAHGTNAGASGAYSSAVEYPGGGSGTTRTAESRLLKMDNRGLCIKCHVGY